MNTWVTCYERTENELILLFNADGGNAEIMNLVNALTEDELDALAEVFYFQSFLMKSKLM